MKIRQEVRTFCRVSMLSENMRNRPSLLSTPGTAVCRSLNSRGKVSLASGVRLSAGSVCSCASFCRLDMRICTRLRIRHACWNLTPALRRGLALSALEAAACSFARRRLTAP